jgi:small-conductance mechanosensitive channel
MILSPSNVVTRMFDDFLDVFKAFTWPQVIWLLVAVLSAFIFYKVSAFMMRRIILKAKGTEGDVKMIVGLWRVAVSFLSILIIFGSFFQLGLITTVVGAFGGMFLGWALQQPVSGVAAWLMVTMKRPFRVGDRIRLPSYKLAGDVTDVGAMYTVLDQVGGAVGSEEAVGRNILIPNAMLFSNLIINYTPKKTPNGLIEDEPALKKARESAYTLDEVVVRITFDSDWNAAENILLEAARSVTEKIISETNEEPYIRSDMYDYGVYMRLRYMTLATNRPRIKYEIEKRVFKEFSRNERVDFAIPYVYSSRKGRSESQMLKKVFHPEDS